ITASIQSIQRQPGRLRLELSDIVHEDGARLNGLARLSWYVKRAGPRSELLQPGDQIRAEARFRRPANFHNPGAFDYQAYCFDNHIALLGSIRGKPEITAHDAGILDSMRQRIRQGVAPIPPEQGGVILALLLADRSLIPVDVSDAFMASGAAHLLAISGLHVGLVAAWAFFLCRWLLTRREAWIVALPVQKISLSFGLLACCAYATLAGWPLPTERATLLFAAAVLAWWLRLRAAQINTLLAALMLILFWDPAAIASISLWLSFTATAALLIWAGRLDGGSIRPVTWLLAMLWISLLAALATLPLIALAFERVSTYTLLANALLVPLFSLLVLPLAMLGEIAAIGGLGDLAAMAMRLSAQALLPGIGLIDALYTWPGAKFFLPSPAWWIGVMYAAGLIYAGRLWLIHRRPHAIFAAGFTLVAYLLLVTPERPPEQMQFIVWDVGQGASSSLLMPSGRVMVVDAPGYPGSRFNGGSTVAAGLRALGLAHIDVLVASHAQFDHMGGAERLLEQLRGIGELWLADTPDNHKHAYMKKLLARMHQAGVGIRWLARGDVIQSGNVSTHVLWPPRGFSPSNANNASLVLSLQTPIGSILLPGDIEKQTEKALLENGMSAHELSLMPHHGSKTSSTPAWITALNPEHVIAQTGRGNAYGFPRPAIVKRYADHGSQIWDTKDGAVMVVAHTTGWQLRTWRDEGVNNRLFALQWWLGRH
ncbi:MAG: DNA internalization-related competence protein ComEC/Rec2, partial [Mariprofundaceae bacterium]